jgi:hypothetical protein
MVHNFIPGPDGRFEEWQNTLMVGVAPKAPAWNISTEAVAEVQAVKARWSAAYALAIDPATRTKGVIDEKRAARKAYEAALRKFIRIYLTNNPALTIKDRDDLGLPIYKTSRTPAPVASDAPDCEVDTSVLGRIIFHFFEKGGKRGQAKPPGQHGGELAWAVRDTPPADWSDLTHSSFDTHSPLTLVFGIPERGKTLYYALRWENTRGAKGPWSEIATAIIP